MNGELIVRWRGARGRNPGGDCQAGADGPSLATAHQPMHGSDK